MHVYYQQQQQSILVNVPAYNVRHQAQGMLISIPARNVILFCVNANTNVVVFWLVLAY